jgi:hypothetical protein
MNESKKYRLVKYTDILDNSNSYVIQEYTDKIYDWENTNPEKVFQWIETEWLEQTVVKNDTMAKSAFSAFVENDYKMSTEEVIAEA